MLRTQIQLDPRDHALLKSWADQRGLSMSAAVRLILRERLRGEEVDTGRSAFLEAKGVICGDPDETASRDHDRILYGG